MKTVQFKVFERISKIKKKVSARETSSSDAPKRINVRPIRTELDFFDPEITVVVPGPLVRKHEDMKMSLRLDIDQDNATSG